MLWSVFVTATEKAPGTDTKYLWTEELTERVEYSEDLSRPHCYKTKIAELCFATHTLQKHNVEPEGPACGVTQSDPTYTVKLNGAELGEAIHRKSLKTS